MIYNYMKPNTEAMHTCIVFIQKWKKKEKNKPGMKYEATLLSPPPNFNETPLLYRSMSIPHYPLILVYWGKIIPPLKAPPDFRKGKSKQSDLCNKVSFKFKTVCHRQGVTYVIQT